MRSHRIDKVTTQQASGHKNNNVGTRRREYEAEEIVHETTYLRSRYIIERLGGNIRSGSLEYFFNHVLPPMKPGLNIDHIFDSCIKAKMLAKRGRSKIHTWKGVRKNSEGTEAHKTRFVNIFRAITRMTQRNASVKTSSGITFTHFDILDDNSKLKSGSDGVNSQDNVIYLENAL